MSGTIVVQFGTAPTTQAGAVGHLSAEIDSRPTVAGGLNNGQTGFAPGSVIYLLVYRSTHVRVASASTSAGSISTTGSVATVMLTEDVSFTNSRDASLSRPVVSVNSVTWMGSSLGVLTVQPDRMTVRATSSGVAVARVTYTAQAEVWRLTTLSSVGGQTSYPVQVAFQGEIT